MGRPRKLRPEDSITVTASPEAGEGISTTLNGGTFLPFHGSDNIKPGEKRYFVAQGKKLIVKFLSIKARTDDGTPLYKLNSRCVTSLNNRSKHKVLIAKLKELKIPGADNIGL